MAESSESGLRRDLGTLESYAALIGILIGAGIFRVTSEAYAQTGASVILGHVVLAPMVFATSIAYAVFLSTPLGRGPGGEYTHVAQTFRMPALAFVGAWLKLIAYIGACAFLAVAQADYLAELARMLGAEIDPERWRAPLALAGLAFFYFVQAAGVRWFGRVQVVLCLILALAVVVLVVPGLFAIDTANYSPFFAGGASGFAASLAPIFFAYAGFESVAQAAGEVRDSERTLPRVFLRGVIITSLIYVLMSLVAMGVLSGEELAGHEAPMTAVAQRYLPAGAALLVTVGAIAAVATSLNASLLVPARLGWTLARDGHLPRWIGHVHHATATPLAALTTSTLLAALLILTGQLSLALNIAVLALVLLYALHSLALVVLPRANPELFAQVTSGVPPRWQRRAGCFSVVSMLAIVGVIAVGDVQTIGSASPLERLAAGGLTSIELALVWAAVGMALYVLRGRQR